SQVAETPHAPVQAVPAGAMGFGAHVRFVPSQADGERQADPALHTVPSGAGCCAGQDALMPSHFDAEAHPSADLQTIPFGIKPSGGQTVLRPLQDSAGSQIPVDGWQTVNELA